METVLIIGSTGHIGVSAAISALRTGRQVLAIVRNQTSAAKLFKHVGSSDGITVVEADIMSETGVKGVVDRVRKGELPAFQHVYCCPGGDYDPTPLRELNIAKLHKDMTASLDTTFYAYQATIDYLREQPVSTSWVRCTGAQGDLGIFASPSITQGALFSFCTVAARENEGKNVRFNELYLAFRVEVDEDARAHGVMTATEFANVYAEMLERKEISGTRVKVATPEDVKEIKWQKKF